MHAFMTPRHFVYLVVQWTSNGWTCSNPDLVAELSGHAFAEDIALMLNHVASHGWRLLSVNQVPETAETHYFDTYIFERFPVR